MKPEGGWDENKEMDWCDWNMYVSITGQLPFSRAGEAKRLVAPWTATATYWPTGGFERRRSSERHLNLKEDV